ncbi:MAG: hypothetical protein O2960_09240 [Verrucomicrobia bacterium]|nr:hypothetical protein [Verrucomicrobiota bacterium]
MKYSEAPQLPPGCGLGRTAVRDRRAEPVTLRHHLAWRRTRHTRTEGSYVDFTYENLGQLQSAIGKESGAASRLNEQFRYGYDTAWNLSSRTNNASRKTDGTASPAVQRDRRGARRLDAPQTGQDLAESQGKW